MNYTQEQVKEILTEVVKLAHPGEPVANLADELYEICGDIVGDSVETSSGYTVECEDNFGGEGQGDDFWYVLSVKETNQDESQKIYIRFVGWYASHHGYEFDNGNEFEFVEPKQVLKTVWKAVGES